MKKRIRIKLPEQIPAPNIWHQEQVMKGGKVHKNHKKTIPRKMKYKDM